MLLLPGLNAAVFAPAASAALAKPATPPRRRTRAVGLLGAVAQAREVGASAVLPHDQDAALAAFAHPPSGARTLGEATSGLLLNKQGINDAETAADLIRDLAGRLAPDTTRREVRQVPAQDHN